MAKVLLSLILLLTFITATAAELSCDCVEETGIHQDENKKESSEENEHCQHTCTQCHFAAVVPKAFILNSESVISYLCFNSIEQLPVQFSKSHFRPPIA